MSAPLTAQESSEREVEVEGVAIKLISYRIAERFFARAHDLALGDLIGRASGVTRGDAEAAAIDAASMRLGMSAARASMKRSLDHLGRKDQK